MLPGIRRMVTRTNQARKRDKAKLMRTILKKMSKDKGDLTSYLGLARPLKLQEIVRNQDQALDCVTFSCDRPVKTKPLKLKMRLAYVTVIKSST